MSARTLEEAKEQALALSRTFECIDVEIHVSRSPVCWPTSQPPTTVVVPHYYVSENYSWNDTVATFINGCERKN